jgi:hypothetical protein
MNTKLKWGTAGRLRRGAVVLGVVGLTAGAAVLTAGSALAGVGSQPGSLELLSGGSVVTSGLLSSSPTWATTTACPSGDQTSALLQEYTVPPGASGTSIAPAVNSSSEALNAPFSGSLLTGATVGALLNFAGVSATSPGTVEWVVECDSNAGGAPPFVPTQSLFVSVAAGATTYTTSATGPVVVGTTTTLTATPNPAPVSATPNVTLNATVEAANSTFPAGTVQFEAGGSPIGSAVAVNAGNVNVPATTTVGFAAAGPEALSAVFVPSSTTSFSGSSGTFSLAVGSLAATGTNPVVVNVAVPSTGTLTVSVATGSVTLTPASPQATPDETAAGTLNTVTVNDSRNTLPGWSVAGQESVFNEAAPGTATIPANSLGWTPAFVAPAVDGAQIGTAVAPVGADTGSTGPGLGTAATLASATPSNGFGINTLNAALLLDIPSATPPGSYAGNLTITYVTAGP